jgi:hypothetical protein
MRTAPALAAMFAALCSTQAALAQDSRFPPVPFYDWTGVYVGANLGYASATINDTTTSGGVSTTSSQTMTGSLAEASSARISNTGVRSSGSKWMPMPRVKKPPAVR